MSPRLLALLAASAALAACLLAPAAASAGSCPAVGPYDGASSAPGSDPLRARQWGLDQIRAPAAWARGARGAGAVIAVLDTGTDLNHPDLQGKLVPGADIVDPADGGCPGPQDEEGHGTHVSGIAAAATGNGIGTAGAAPDAKIMPIRVLGADGSGSVEGIAAGMRLAADRGADVLNLSLGDLPVLGQAPALNGDLEDAAAYAWSKGAIVIAAAGNESFPLCSYPAAAANAVCVAATDRQGFPTLYSNLPNDSDAVGVRAPGGLLGQACEHDEDIWSTIWPGSASDCGTKGYETLAGTSMSSPYVAGVAALLAGQGLSNAKILDCLKKHSSNGGSFDPVLGYGIVDADAATAACGGSGSGPGGGAGPGGSGADGAPVVRLRLGRTTLRKLVRTGRLRLRMTASERSTTSLRAYTNRRSRNRRTARRTSTLGRRSVTLRRAGSKSVTLKLSRSGRRALRGRRSAVLTVVARARDTAGNSRTGAARKRYRR